MRRWLKYFRPSFDSRKAFAPLVLMLCALLLTFSAPSALAEKGDFVSNSKSRLIYIPFGKAELIQVNGDVSDIMVANPSIVDVTAVNSHRLYAVGLTVGDTNLIALDANGDVIEKLDIHVKYDLDAIQDLVGKLFPEENIKVGSVHDQIYVTGTVSTPETASKAANIIGQYVSDLTDSTDPLDTQISNMLVVRGEQQVTLKVKIVEASRTLVKELGIKTNANDPNELSTSTLFGVAPPSNIGDRRAAASLGTGAGIALTEDATGIARFLHESGIDVIGDINVVLEALDKANLVNILAEPNLTAVSGEQAGFLAGGEFPVPSGRDQVGNLVIDFREFGVSLNFRPTVLSDQRIALQMNTEVSSLDFDNAIVLEDTTVPGLDVRKAETSVEVPSGASLMIAGLLQAKAIKGLAGLPGIKNAPVLGKLVSSNSFQREETELLIFVTPYLVEPFGEKDTAKQVKAAAAKPLAAAFAHNIERAYDIQDKTIFTDDGSYGYILD
jgi:pilus assembly protein CpaC